MQYWKRISTSFPGFIHVKVQDLVDKTKLASYWRTLKIELIWQYKFFRFMLMIHRLDQLTMFRIRGWERYKFSIDFANRQVNSVRSIDTYNCSFRIPGTRIFHAALIAPKSVHQIASDKFLIQLFLTIRSWPPLSPPSTKRYLNVSFRTNWNWLWQSTLKIIFSLRFEISFEFCTAELFFKTYSNE